VRQRSAWTLNKLLVLLLALTWLGLAGDLRYEHVDRVHKHWTAWIPIVYSGAMFVLSLACLAAWERLGRRVLFFGFALGIVVGVLGFWLHNEHHVQQNLTIVLATWVRPEHHADKPPALAPLSICGLAAVGMLACAARFQPVSPTRATDA
jgi:hypothetical protein